MKTPETCIEEARREKVRAANLNGLDYVEVTGDKQQTLEVYFLGKAPEPITVEGKPPRLPITEKNVRVEGGRRIRDVRVTGVSIHRDPNPRRDDWMEVTVDKTGDFSPYILRLVETDVGGRPIIERDESGREQFRPLHGFDPRYAEIEFSFKPECPSELDCQTAAICPPEKRDEPEISYLAKDYASFRQLILDRLALIMPDWREQHVPDIGIALVEVLAYVGDYLSYYQDAVGTEAYLDTARERISVRRHARLVDYHMHEGCNARAWVYVEITGGDQAFEPAQIAFITGYNMALAGSSSMLGSDEVAKLPAGTFEYFEPLVEAGVKEIQFRQAHNEIDFYTWGDRQCCLPRGSTSATLLDKWEPARVEEKKGDAEGAPSPEKQYPGYCPPPPPRPEPPTRWLDLAQGDFILFEEMIGPKTGNSADKDPARRHVVRLTRVTQIDDPLYRETLPGYADDFPTPLVEIEWAPEDALPFPFCISVIGPAEVKEPCRMIENISVARGNVILVDHGRTIEPEEQPPLGPVPTESSEISCEGEGRPSETTLTPGRFRPHLRQRPLVFAEPLAKDAAASARLAQDPRKALPIVTLKVAAAEPDGGWEPHPDLLSSGGEATHFVVEIDDEGIAHLRFGDGEAGRMPEAGTVFNATYRVGGGLAGNVGAGAISCVVLRGGLTLSGVTLRARNPLPARGGTAPEPIAEVKLFAPRAFRKELQRAITADDYAAIVMREFPGQVQRAGAELRWTGGWYSVRVAIDPRGTLEVSPSLLQKIARSLRLYRRMGHDVQVVPARYVPIDVAMAICLQPHFLRGHVEAALLDVFRSGLRPDGQPGFFHPDNLTFGDAVYLSRLVMAAQAVEGVESVQVTKLERLFEGENGEIEQGFLPIGPLEVARLDADPDNPENGILTLTLKGGR